MFLFQYVMIKEIHSLFYLNHKKQDQNMRHVFFAVNPINLLILPFNYTSNEIYLHYSIVYLLKLDR